MSGRAKTGDGASTEDVHPEVASGDVVTGLFAPQLASMAAGASEAAAALEVEPPAAQQPAPSAPPEPLQLKLPAAAPAPSVPPQPLQLKLPAAAPAPSAPAQPLQSEVPAAAPASAGEASAGEASAGEVSAGEVSAQSEVPAAAPPIPAPSTASTPNATNRSWIEFLTSYRTQEQRDSQRERAASSAVQGQARAQGQLAPRPSALAEPPPQQRQPALRFTVQQVQAALYIQRVTRGINGRMLADDTRVERSEWLAEDNSSGAMSMLFGAFEA